MLCVVAFLLSVPLLRPFCSAAGQGTFSTEPAASCSTVWHDHGYIISSFRWAPGLTEVSATANSNINRYLAHLRLKVCRRVPTPGSRTAGSRGRYRYSTLVFPSANRFADLYHRQQCSGEPVGLHRNSVHGQASKQGSICISLIISDLQHLFLHLWII